MFNENMLNEYSLEEKVVGKWIDGKPLYRKVINMGNLKNAEGKSVVHGLSNAVIRTFNGAATNGVVTISISGWNDEIYINNAFIVWNTKTDRSAYTAYIILEYTKITD